MYIITIVTCRLDSDQIEHRRQKQQLLRTEKQCIYMFKQRKEAHKWDIDYISIDKIQEHPRASNAWYILKEKEKKRDWRKHRRVVPYLEQAQEKVKLYWRSEDIKKITFDMIEQLEIYKGNRY